MALRFTQIPFLVLLLAALYPGIVTAQSEDLPLERFFAAASLDPDTARPAQAEIALAWRDGYASIFVDLIDVLQRVSFVDPRGFVQMRALTDLLSEQTGQDFGADFAAWRRWVWSEPYAPHANYGLFKGLLYSMLDPAFQEFFVAPVATSIRLDEVQWGGVAVNGIPPLEYPAVVAVEDADYLDDGDIVFGIAVGGETRAYPQRIFAWHELALDRVGGEELTIVYCTLCGTVIPFRSEVGGVHRTFGTSGLLYQSNKLMFDAGTRSLWSSLTGEPVVGPLVGSGLSLNALPVVTTTWRQWRQRHPATTVLSIDTGFERDYSEGAAYRQYFRTDTLMFDVSARDSRLPNKAEVLVLRSLADGYDAASPAAPPYAVAVGYLSDRPVYTLTVADHELVVLTIETGANRVYRSDGIAFLRLEGNDVVIDSENRGWTITETELTSDFEPELRLPRVSAHRAFWFGWYAQHPDTILIR